MITSEIYNRPMHWDVIDYFIYQDGRRELARPIDHNIVVNNCSVLIACLMRGLTNYKGISYWAVGSGLSTWDTAQPEPTISDDKLQIEVYRKAVTYDNFKFIDSANQPSASPTNRIELVVTFSETEANSGLREFALFGGNATSSLNSGIMINHKIHPLINKTNAVKLERTIRMTF